RPTLTGIPASMLRQQYNFRWIVRTRGEIPANQDPASVLPMWSFTSRKNYRVPFVVPHSHLDNATYTTDLPARKARNDPMPWSHPAQGIARSGPVSVDITIPGELVSVRRWPTDRATLLTKPVLPLSRMVPYVAVNPPKSNARVLHKLAEATSSVRGIRSRK